jgi:hypothetical protein
MNHLVQTGLFGVVGRFRATDRGRREAGTRVICRTSRGLETGTVLKPLASDERTADGDLLRQVAPEDQLLIDRIEQFRDHAYQTCRRLLQQRGLSAALVDVEHLFDGQTLYFYFLGEVSDEVSQMIGELAEAYEARVKFRRFSQLLAAGCGPDCGTRIGGCSDGGCNGCSVRSVCHSAAAGRRED